MTRRALALDGLRASLGRGRRLRGERIAVRPSRMSPLDLGSEVVAGLFTRPGRTSLTVVAIVIGLAALVTMVGLSRTASNRIVGRFDELAATEVVVRARPAPSRAAAVQIPWDAAARLQRLEGVVVAGTLSAVDVGGALVRTAPVSDPRRQTAFRLSVEAASPGLFETVRASLRSGRFLDLGDSLRAERVAVLGPSAALRLGIRDVANLPAIGIGDDPYLVIGILDDVARRPELLGAVIIPEGTAQREFRLLVPEFVVVETAIGASALISQQIPVALRPDDPRAIQVVSPPEPRRVRDRVQNDLDVLFFALGGVALLVGAIGIANVTLVSVIERTGEIGLRRALGATRRHIAAQFLLESGAMGLVGGVLAASLGTLIVVAVSAYQSWTPVLDPAVPFLIPPIGAVTGLLAGAYPALRAARMAPVDALRSGT